MQLSKPRVVIIGAGFGGLQAAKSLKNVDVDVILIDKSNHHLFQPLLYQVAISALSPADIAMPIRAELRNYKNVQIIMDEAIRIEKDKRKVILKSGEIEFDYLILSPGSRHSYFSHPEWEEFAPGLKDLQDGLKMRERILSSFEKAERFYNQKDSDKYKTFVIVGGGPTGVELAGSISEIAQRTMLVDFPILTADDIKIYLIEAGDRLLPSFAPELSDYTLNALKSLKVEVMLNTLVKNIESEYVETNEGKINTTNVIWAAGNQASPLVKSLGLELDKSGRAIVNHDLSIPNFKNIFVIGDAALVNDGNNIIVPGVAQGAIQGAIYVANIIKNRKKFSNIEPFKYKDKGNMATIGRAKAICEIGKLKLTGFPAWAFWGLLHIFFLINFRNRFRVMFEWFWFYFTYKPGARLIYNNEKNKINHS